MTERRKQRDSERENRLSEAEEAAASVEEQGQRVEHQVNFIKRLTVGWRKVHEHNHFAQLFREEGHLG